MESASGERESENYIDELAAVVEHSSNGRVKNCKEGAPIVGYETPKPVFGVTD